MPRPHEDPAVTTFTGDELAGIVDLFGGLTREELREAAGEAAFRAGEDVDEDALTVAVEDAVEDYRLAAYDDPDGDDEWLVAGPAAFPTLPDGARDLPHILDVERRDVDRERAGDAVRGRFRRDAAITVDAGDAERAAWLLDLSYDVETWAPVEMGDIRAILDEAAGDEPVAVDPGDEAAGADGTGSAEEDARAGSGGDDGTDSGEGETGVDPGEGGNGDPPSGG